ncbi:MAG TPA: hypothetical protein VFS21_40365 [Roseiflexaceae bacterium]|nr:hypothetical protein [Roseiflexaceae bacterium]
MPTPNPATLDTQPIQPWQQVIQPGSFVIVRVGPSLLYGQIAPEHSSDLEVGGTWFSPEHPQGQFVRYHRSLIFFQIPPWLFERQQHNGWRAHDLSAFDLLEAETAHYAAPPEPAEQAEPITAPAHATDRQHQQLKRLLVAMRDEGRALPPAFLAICQELHIKTALLVQQPARITKTQLLHDDAARLIDALTLPAIS